MAVTYKTLETIGFTKVKDQDALVRAVGDNCVLVASGNNIFMNGALLINTEFIDLEGLKKYIEKAVQSKRKDGDKAE